VVGSANVPFTPGSFGCLHSGTLTLGRTVDMCIQAGAIIGATATVPTDITARCEAVREIRNAYEHIEDRAVGNVRNAPHADALTIFDHQQVVVDGVITYGIYQLDLATDVPRIIAAARQGRH
jgi:hypothetical protein